MKHYWDSPFEIPNILNQMANSPLFKKFTDSIAKKLLSDTIIFNNIASSQSFADNYTAVNNRRKFFEQQYYSKSLRIFKNLKNDAVLQEFINNKIDEKSDLFKTIPKDLAETVVPLINKWNVQGLTSKQMSKEKLQGQISDLLDWQVRRIARTETSKTSVDIIEFKAKKCNVPCYIWRASGGGKGDGRTRKSHRCMADVIVFWNDPPAPEDLFPIYGENGKKYKNTLGNYHAGCCPNCRCVPSPVIFKDDLKFPVRVYTNGKIVSMQKTEFDNLYNSRISQMKAELQREKEQAEQKKVKEELPKEKEIKTSEEKNISAKELEDFFYNLDNPKETPYIIDRIRINSEGYAEDCKQLFIGNQNLNKEILELSRVMFNPQSYTQQQSKYYNYAGIVKEDKLEKLFIMDITGTMYSANITSTDELGVNFTDEQKQDIEDLNNKHTPFIVIHNHPTGGPPTPRDFYTTVKYNYSIGIVLGNNGTIYKYYKPNWKMKKEDVDNIEKEIKMNTFSYMPRDISYQDVYKKHKLFFERIYYKK